ncbi:hypothetical protein J2S74_000824 [Evansella vedderi]|uniref:Uncharacterized protein n=1 Tax=Evansella vedderi TaxID=38282 RepID=A0ABT9ZRS6_9BACI|nr:hypothetical protein [Evansella vedderi]
MTTRYVFSVASSKKKQRDATQASLLYASLNFSSIRNHEVLLQLHL